jgi:cytochrome oxidase Cu insertion factor (SCO1/SenC/PrrC family)
MALNKSQRSLLIMAAIFIGPMLLAYVLVNNMHQFGEFNTKNHGELIDPAKPLQDINLSRTNGEEFKLSDLRNKWVMVYIGSATCDTKCSENLYKMRQSRLAQGGELKRIKRLYISIDGKPANSLQTVLSEHQGLEVVYGSASQIQQVLEQFDLTQQAVANETVGMFIVDPLGNLVMRYQTGFEAKGLVKDLSLLLKASYIG